MTTREIRKKYLDFFASKGHSIVPSASLIPENDPTTLFTGSGMQPMIPYLLGEPHPMGRRVADSQKSFRTQDMPEIGDNRHTTFFEMLGNWSFGDYFKREQITWIFEFLTNELTLDPSRLYFTCYAGNASLGIPQDKDSAFLWKRLLEEKKLVAKIVDDPDRGMQGGRIFFYGDEKNWWSRTGAPSGMPEGEPGGPDSEMFWDFDAEHGLHESSAYRDKPCHPNCDCGRFLEIGNNVFMEYRKTASGFEKLSQRNVDFGGGLERLAAATGNDPDVFMIDVFEPLRKTLERLSGKKYGDVPEETNAFRAIMDHVRAATFLIADGAIPSNKDQGYFTRRLIRRAVRFAHTLGVSKTFCADLASAVIKEYADAYPDLAKKRAQILSATTDEEKKFQASVSLGLSVYERIARPLAPGGTIGATEAFDLYQSYGFPLEMTIELARARGLTVDASRFDEDMKKHQETSRAGTQQKFKGGLADSSAESTRYHTATHLLHQALRMVLGNHVEQRGSNITRERMRFDFAHPRKMTGEEIKKVENIVNEQIKKDMPVHFEVLDMEEAKQRGALGFFEDKYAQLGGKIKVYFIGDESVGYFSREICGGPHVEHTGEIGGIKITKEEAVSAGIRRIKAIFIQSN